MSKNILVTGITGFFGRNFTSHIQQHFPDINLVGTAHSESKLALFKKLFPNIRTYVVELSSDNIQDSLESIIVTHQINYIIHAAAMKHVDICQENPEIAYRVNVIASHKLLELAKKHKVNNLIALSTDKSIDPCNNYGEMKQIMQNDVLDHGYSIYQGANFFWSDGSVLDIWFNQYIHNQPLTIRNPNHVRYFNTIDHVCQRIIDNIDATKTIILPEHVYIITLQQLLDAFTQYFEYTNIKSIPTYSYEKIIECISDKIETKIPTDIDTLKELLKNYHNNML